MNLLKPKWILLLIIGLFSARCGSTDEPRRPGNTAEERFEVLSGEVQGVETIHGVNTYTLALTSKSGSRIYFDISAMCFNHLTGRYVLFNEPVDGAITNLKYIHGGRSVNAENITLTLSEDNGNYDFSGLLAIASDKQIPISGKARLELPQPERVVIFPTPISIDETEAGMKLDFSTAKNDADYGYSLRAVFPNAMKMEDFVLDASAVENPFILFSIICPSVRANGKLEISDFSIDITPETSEITTSDNMLLGNLAYENCKISFSSPLPQSQPDVSYIDLPYLLSATYNEDDFITLKLAQKGVEMTYDPISWQTSYSGTGKMLSLEIYAREGKLLPGTYPVADTPVPNTFRAGWNPGDLYNIGIDFENWGTCLFDFKEGNQTVEHITDGAVIIDCTEDVYVIRLISSKITAKYSGNILPTN